ncbi:CopD family protein [Azospirillum sp.]|uniref:CopD family protein n=1 Tax=Azospirillum sp. TaxID=34012 RepID=UPI002D6BA73F|nr:CopD family protein [Azospirillum sp.]HYD64443.1 CopD family protein [Azospirillum sp.]
MDYLWLKALHIAAVATWIGGMLAVAVTITAAGSKAADEAAGRSAILNAMRRWDRRATTPAMLLAWALGLMLALQGGWFTAPWLMVKLAFVVLLSALHGVLSGTLRRLVRADESSPPAILRHAPIGIAAAIFAVVVLVVVKPF